MNRILSRIFLLRWKFFFLLLSVFLSLVQLESEAKPQNSRFFLNITSHGKLH